MTSDAWTLDLIGRLRASTVDDVAIDLTRTTVDRLCTDYAAEPAPSVLAEAQKWLREIVSLRDKRLTLKQHRDVYELAGWLSLLVACLHHDQGDARSAEASRSGALLLGKECGSSELVAWAAEIKAWIALTRGDDRAVLAATREGLAATRTHGVAVQLLAQEAKAWARLGNRARVEVALDTCRALLDALPYPDNPRNHFQVDPGKFDFYAMDCYRAVGEDDVALALAETVARSSATPSGAVISPMRLAEAELTRATVYARADEVELATASAASALGRGRRSLPSLLMVGHEFVRELEAKHPHGAEAGEFSHHLRELQREARPRHPGLGSLSGAEHGRQVP